MQQVFLQYRGLNNEKTQNMQILTIVSHFMNIFHYLPINSFKHFIELIVKSKMKSLEVSQSSSN